MSSSAATRPFVGRERQLGQIAEGIEEVLGGRGRLFLLTGEPGIGKTRLADEIATLGGRRSLPVVWGRSWEAGGAPAYWPWLEVLATLARGLDDQSLVAALGDGAPQVAELVPEIARRLGGGPLSAAPPSDEARFRFWRAVSGLIRRAAAVHGFVLVFEDLHAADHASLALLHFVACELRSMRALLIGTCRDVEARLDPQAGEIIARIGREGITLALARLDRGASEALVRQRAGEVSAAVVARIFESTQGNPLFVEEMLRLVGEEGPEAMARGALPSGVRDVIRQRLDRVDPGARALLDLAAVAGDEVDLPLLVAASERPRSAIVETIAEAVRVGVLAERGGRPRFSHALVREVLYRELAADDRRVLHGRIAAALEKLHSGREGLPLAELAYHALEGPVESLNRAVSFAVQAAARSLELLAPDEAIALLGQASTAIEAAGNPPSLRARVLLALGEAHIQRGDVVAGRNACCEAATLARAIGDADLVGRAALAYGRVFVFAVVDPILVGMLEEALGALAPGDSPMRARLLARLGAALQPATRTAEPARLALDAIEVARRLDDPRILLETIHDGLSALVDVADPRERLALGVEAEQLATELGDRERLLRTHARLAIDHLALGELAAADARIEAFAALAAELKAPWFGWRAWQLRAVRAVMEGRFADAEGHAAQALEAGRRAADQQVDRCVLLQREGMLRTMERHDDMIALDPQARRERARIEHGRSWQWMGSAQVYARLEDVDKTRRHLDPIPEAEIPTVDNVYCLAYITEPVALVGSKALAERLYGLLLPHAHENVMRGMSALSWDGPVPRLLGLLAARLERWDDARAHFEDALVRLRALAARPYLARTEYELGRTLLGRGLAADSARARDLIASALRTAEELGMPGLVRLCRARLDGGTSTAAEQTPPGPPSIAVGPISFSMALEGEYWTIAYGGATFRLKDGLGLQYLARLVGTPGREVHVLDLAGGSEVDPAGGQVADHGDAGELLDDEARADYKRRLEDLRETVAEAESFGDTARASRAREEIEFLGAELSRAVGLGGRARRAGSAAERARSAVQRRIKNALDRIGEASSPLGTYLGRTVKTGNFCVFRPESG